VGIAEKVLNYQPFFITSELQTGVAYSVLHSHDARISPPLVFHRRDWSEEEWAKIAAANQGQRAMYDAFTNAIAQRYPGGSLLDVACNNGYVPVAARMAGMGRCAGLDSGLHQRHSVAFLNAVLGTDVQFFHRSYSPIHKCAEILPQKFDVVCALAILCHLPDPLHFLSYLASLANEAVFFWGQVIDTGHFLVSYKNPHPNLGSARPFPYGFNDNTRLSMGLFQYAMESMGFSRQVEIPYDPWIPDNMDSNIESQLALGCQHRALLFCRK
jgi:hypothetical protein